jgi:hypothetical protein
MRGDHNDLLLAELEMLNSVASRSMLWQIDIILEPLKEFMTSSVLTFEKSYNMIQYDHGSYSCEPRVKTKIMHRKNV